MKIVNKKTIYQHPHSTYLQLFESTEASSPNVLENSLSALKQHKFEKKKKVYQSCRCFGEVVGERGWEGVFILFGGLLLFSSHSKERPHATPTAPRLPKPVFESAIPRYKVECRALRCTASFFFRTGQSKLCTFITHFQS